ncbi:hypothetical protein P3X46_001977 [Hevea brasiliensis]|uniref:Uncharacterized protein n=1 Tax=Hevea brasiliensis TaxID=3981 RepID=A0ABQ9N238_HEVBR|nr:hypothetical protein P3X46_001977 [Hevea brasiliensis]
MGQIKLKKKMVISKAKRALPQETKAVPSPRKINKHASTIKKLFSSAKPTDRRRSNASIYEKQPLSERAPALSRDTFASIDWTDHISPVDSDHRGYYSDGEEEEEEVIIPFSAPIIIGPAVALQPRKEVNLWKRRAMNPPRPLQLNLIRAI